MEQHYMTLIFGVFALKENENLTVKEQQDKIVEILSDMKKDAQDFAKNSFRKICKETINDALNTI